jgi:hypothetical protein
MSFRRAVSVMAMVVLLVVLPMLAVSTPAQACPPGDLCEYCKFRVFLGWACEFVQAGGAGHCYCYDTDGCQEVGDQCYIINQQG